MPAQRQRPRRYARRRKKRHPIRNFIMFLLIVAISGSTLYFVASNMSKTRNILEETAYPIKYSEYVDRAADEYQLNKPFIYAIIRTESKFDPEVTSYVGAKGLMQLMPDTFQWLAKLRGETVDPDTYSDPDVNIDYGCYFLRYLLDRYEDETTAAAAYNAGHNKVDQWLSDSSLSSDGKTLDTIPYPETKQYVEKVEYAKVMYKKLYF